MHKSLLLLAGICLAVPGVARADLVEDWMAGKTVTAPSGSSGAMTELKFGHPAPPASIVPPIWRQALENVSTATGGELAFKEYGAGSMLILTLPFVIPVIVALGVDKVWFGIFITMMIELALITPPVGLNVFVLRRVATSVPIGEIFRGAAPFVLLIALNVAMLFLWPGLALWLPSQMN